jgi:hypothetical protein
LLTWSRQALAVLFLFFPAWSSLVSLIPVIVSNSRSTWSPIPPSVQFPIFGGWSGAYFWLSRVVVVGRYNFMVDRLVVMLLSSLFQVTCGDCEPDCGSYCFHVRCPFLSIWCSFAPQMKGEVAALFLYALKHHLLALCHPFYTSA